MNVVSRICNKHLDSHEFVNKKLVPYILDLLLIPISAKLQEKIVFLLCLLIKENANWGKDWIDNHPDLFDKLMKLEDDKIPSANYLIA